MYGIPFDECTGEPGLKELTDTGTGRSAAPSTIKGEEEGGRGRHRWWGRGWHRRSTRKGRGEDRKGKVDGGGKLGKARKRK